jgi:hypothetical protein
MGLRQDDPSWEAQGSQALIVIKFDFEHAVMQVYSALLGLEV